MMQPHTSYLICAPPRCGSTLLCEALINTGLAGHPREYFEHLKQTGQPRRPQEYFPADSAIARQLGDYSRLDDEAKLSEHYQGSAYSAYLAQVIEEGTTPNGVFGAKVMWGYLDDFISNLREIPGYQELPALDLLSNIFPNLRYIWATRRDKVRQAVSLWKAIQTWTWKQEETDGTHLVCRLLLEKKKTKDNIIKHIQANEAEW